MPDASGLDGLSGELREYLERIGQRLDVLSQRPWNERLLFYGSAEWDIQRFAINQEEAGEAVGYVSRKLRLDGNPFL